MSTVNPARLRVLVTSDLHLSDRIWKHRPIEGDSYFSWQQIVDYATSCSVDVVILAGDVLDKRVNTSEPIYRLTLGVQDMLRAGVRVLNVQGQHELLSSPWIGICGHKNNIHLNRSSWSIAFGEKHERTIRFCGIDYSSAEEFQEFLKSDDVGEADVVVCHQVWQDFMGEHGRPQAAFSDIPSAVPILITGDFHVDKTVQSGPTVVISPGSTHVRSLSEPEKKSFAVIDFLADGEDTTEIRYVRLKTRRVESFRAEDHETIDGLASEIDEYLARSAEYASQAKLPENLTKPIVRIVHPASRLDWLPALENRYEKSSHLFFKCESAAVADSESRDSEFADDSRIDMLSCLNQCVDKSNDRDVYDLSVQLMTASEPEEALKHWYESRSGS